MLNKLLNKQELEKLTEKQLQEYLSWLDKHKKSLEQEIKQRKKLLSEVNFVKSGKKKTEDKVALVKIRDAIRNFLSSD